MIAVNCNNRGLALASTNRDLQDLNNRFKPDAIFLMETRAQADRVSRVRRKLRFCNYCCVESTGLSGGLCLLWNDTGMRSAARKLYIGEGRFASREDRDEELAGFDEEVATGSLAGRNQLANLIDLMSDSEMEANKEVTKRLDQATEQELIQNWNSRFNLKKGRADWNALEEIEDELIKRKKFKRESWYDAEGNVLCVAITSEFGNQTFIMDEEGFPKHPSP